LYAYYTVVKYAKFWELAEKAEGKVVGAA